MLMVEIFSGGASRWRWCCCLQTKILFYFVYQLLDRNNIVIVSLFTWHYSPICSKLLLAVVSLAL
jgi:hypothetical protein